MLYHINNIFQNTRFLALRRWALKGRAGALFLHEVSGVCRFKY